MNRGTFRVHSDEFAGKQSPTNAKLRMPTMEILVMTITIRTWQQHAIMDLSKSMLDDVLESPMSSFDSWYKLDLLWNGRAQSVSAHSSMHLLHDALNGAQKDTCLLKNYCDEPRHLKEDDSIHKC